MPKANIGALFVLLALAQTAFGHAVFTCPVPRSTDAGEKTYPCGYNYFNSWNTSTTAIVQPGPLTVTWSETISHTGAPFRVALSIGGDCRYEEFILADHIPHNSAGATPRTYYFTVNIPNVNCMATPCAIQLLQIMTDKLQGTTCNTLGNVANPSCFSVYHSCANLRINGTVDPAAFTYTYVPPAGLANPTPNVWTKPESGTWTAGGWLQGQPTTVYQQPAACTPAPPIVNPSFPASCADCNYPTTCGITRASAPTTTAGLPGGASTTSATTGTTGGVGASPSASKAGPKVGQMQAGAFALAILSGVFFIALIVALVVFVKRPTA